MTRARLVYICIDAAQRRLVPGTYFFPSSSRSSLFSWVIPWQVNRIISGLARITRLDDEVPAVSVETGAVYDIAAIVIVRVDVVVVGPVVRWAIVAALAVFVHLVWEAISDTPALYRQWGAHHTQLRNLTHKLDPWLPIMCRLPDGHFRWTSTVAVANS